MRRVLLLVAVAAMVFVPTAGAWTWPTDGEVLQPFVFDPAHPYAGGEHRGIDVSGPAGADVLAPRAGTVTFAGTVPGSGASVTILTDDGYAVTLTHLGSIAVARGAAVAEGAPVGALGAGGDGEHAQPYVHLGVRVAAQAQGYVDPASLLPARATAPPPAPAPAPAPQQAPVSQVAPAVLQSAPVVLAAAPAAAPAPAAAAPVTTAEPAPADAAPAPAPGLVVRAQARTSAAPVAGGLRIIAAAHAAPAAKTTASERRAVVRPAAPQTAVAAPSSVVRRVAAVVHVRPPAPRHDTSPAQPVRTTVQRPATSARFPVAFAVACALAALLALAGVWKAARIIGRRGGDEAQDPGGSGLALRGWVPAPGPRRRVRPVRRVRALSPLERERRPRGERNRRARHARDGGC